MATLANYISFTRILLSLALLLVLPLSTAYIFIYRACGVSDILDGYLARRSNTVSELGSRLDSLADLIMFFTVIISLYPFIKVMLNTEIIISIVIIAVIRLLSLLVVLIKYKTFAILHTYGNKITGFLLLLFPLLMPVVHLGFFPYILCSVALLSAFEELLIHLLANNLQLNQKSFFSKQA
ncbi:MAG: CDP-alcohol phosphatidyltransferase family protein [Acidaminococcaceae bacterium]